MKLVNIIAAVACGFGMAFAAQATPQHAHQHQVPSAATSAAAAAPVPAHRWTPDGPLKTGIRRAYIAVDQLKHHEMGHMSASMAMDHATEVEHAVTYMFANCKLPAEPDAALHGILVPLLSAARALKTDPQNVNAVANMRTALALYPNYFNDPGWDQPAPVDQAMHDEP